jgi:hypothetical protein
LGVPAAREREYHFSAVVHRALHRERGSAVRIHMQNATVAAFVISPIYSERDTRATDTDQKSFPLLSRRGKDA